MREISKMLTALFTIAAIALSFSSCIAENENCGICLEFVYDWNMNFKDRFKAEVDVVDIYVFDADGKFIRREHVRQENLQGGNRLIFGDELPIGTYKMLTVGGLSDEFRLTDKDGNDLLPEETSLDEVLIELKRDSENVSREFPHLWVSKEPVTVVYTGDRIPQKVHLLKYTNRFNISLSQLEGIEETRAINPYNLEIVTPEAAVYGSDNSPQRKEKVTYKAYNRSLGEEPGELMSGQLNTVRLFYENDYNYKLIVRNTVNGAVLWEYNLMRLLEKTNVVPHPDGYALSMQEYLDRQSQWDIVILYKGEIIDEFDSFVAVAVKVNGWIIWLHDIDV